MKQIFLISTIFLASCLHSPSKNDQILNSSNSEAISKNKLLSSSDVAKKQLIFSRTFSTPQEEKDFQRLLNKKLQMQMREPRKPASYLTESELFGLLSSNFEKGQWDQFDLNMKVFLERFPSGWLTPRVLYLGGLSSIQRKNYASSLKYLRQVLVQFPYSRQAVSALFAKGATLKKMNLNKEAIDTFLILQKKFPGSPESLRAQNEIKLSYSGNKSL